MSGEAGSYYNQGGPPPQGYQQQQQPQPNYYPPQDGGYNQAAAPPNYGAPPQQPFDNKASFQGGNTFQEAFKIEKPKWNDIWASVLLFIVFCGYVAVSGLTINGYSTNRHNSGSAGGIYGNGATSFGLNTNAIILFAFVLVVAAVLSFIYLAVARAFPKQLIWVTGILNIVLAFATAIYMLARKYWSGGVVFLIFAIFTVIFFVGARHRIPFSSLMLKTVIDASKSTGHTYTVSALGGLAALALAAWYSVTFVSVYEKYQPSSANARNPNCVKGSCSNGKVIGLLVFITFATYWLSETLKNFTHVSVSGVYASWYFAPNQKIQGVTRGALRRAATYSFGSISLGSLLVAIIQFLRTICSVAQQQSSGQGDIIGTVFFCILGCFIGILDWAVQFINRYAFSYIAIYGSSYFMAAKRTWTLMKAKGMDILVNDCLVNPVLGFGSMFVAYACALVGYLYVIFTHPAYNAGGQFTPVVTAFSFLIGLQVSSCVTVTISSGLDTLWVAMSNDVEVMMREHAELYQEMIRVYPQVQQAIHA